MAILAQASKDVHPIKRSVAVIGAGAAGLVAAKELRAEGHDVVVFEQASQVGGVWVYDEHGVDSDVLGKDPTRMRVHSSMYAQLRTNLPREIMAYTDLPFHPIAMELVSHWAARQHAGSTLPPDAECTSVDARRFCSHQEVLRYLRAYALYHQLHSLIRFNTHVVSVSALPAEPCRAQHAASQAVGSADASDSRSNSQAAAPPVRWQVITKPAAASQQQQGANGTASASAMQHPQQQSVQEFDALVVANGHYSEPNLPEIPGMEASPVAQMHSHNYRRPQPFAGKVVLVVGASNSGDDISRELSAYASKVLLSARSWKADVDLADDKPYGKGNNIYRRPLASRLTADGRVEFPGEYASEAVDAIIYCTGYRYVFPFLEGSQAIQQHVQSHGAYVSPLYLHLFPPSLAPWLSFIGLPWKVVPFPQFQVQARLVARALSGRVQLPPAADMAQQAAQHLDSLKEKGTPLRYTHMQNLEQFPYNKLLTDMCGEDVQQLPKWREDMYIASGMLKRSEAGVYRDLVWPEQLTSVMHDSAQDIDNQIETLRFALKVEQPVAA